MNGAFAGGTGFSATPFGQRIGQAFQDGTGILLGIDLQAFVHSKTNQEKDKQISSRVGTDGLRYLIAEQKTFNDNTQHSAVLNFDGPRHGLASWLAEPGPMGGLGFVSPHAQFAASVITKNPQDMIAELFALAQAHGPDGIAKMEEIQRLTGCRSEAGYRGVTRVGSDIRDRWTHAAGSFLEADRRSEPTGSSATGDSEAGHGCQYGGAKERGWRDPYV